MPRCRNNPLLWTLSSTQYLWNIFTALAVSFHDSPHKVVMNRNIWWTFIHDPAVMTPASTKLQTHTERNTRKEIINCLELDPVHSFQHTLAIWLNCQGQICLCEDLILIAAYHRWGVSQSALMALFWSVAVFWMMGRGEMLLAWEL